MNESLMFWSPAFLEKLNDKQWLCSHDVFFLAAIVQVEGVRNTRISVTTTCPGPVEAFVAALGEL